METRLVDPACPGRRLHVLAGPLHKILGRLLKERNVVYRSAADLIQKDWWRGELHGTPQCRPEVSKDERDTPKLCARGVGTRAPEMIEKIVSGGQTGADQAGLDVAIELGIPHGGWVPRGRKTEAGRLPDRYHVQEVSSISYLQRTLMNVIDSDGTLLISHGRLSGGSAITKALAAKHRKPCLHIDLDQLGYPEAVAAATNWIDAREIKILNVAGPRASEDPAIYEATKKLLRLVIEQSCPKTVDEAVERLASALPLREKVRIAKMKEKDLLSLDPPLGRTLRGRLRLWLGSAALLESCRGLSGKDRIEDYEASTVVIRRLWETLKATHSLRTAPGKEHSA